MWQVADRSPSDELMFNATGALPGPEAPFLFMYIEQDSHGPHSILQSDELGCLSDTQSKLTFRCEFI